MRNYIIGLFFFTCVTTFALFLPFSLHISDSLVNAGDPLFYAWNLAHNARSVSQGFQNLLNTNIFYPETNTLALSDTLFAQTIITAPIIYITHNPVFAENIYTLLTFPLAAIFMFFLAYYLTKNKPASALAGIFFAFSYPRLAQISHISIISSQWLPLFVLYLIKFFDSGKFKDIVLCFVFFLLLLTSTMYYGVFAIIFGLCITAAYFLKFICQNGKTLSDRLKKIALILLPALCIVVIAVFPYIRLKAEHPEIHRSLDDAAKRSSRFIDYFTVLPTSLSNVASLPKNSNDSVAFPTFTVLIVASLGIIWTAKKRKISLLFIVLAIVSFLLSLGPSQPFILGPYDFGYIKLPYYYSYKIFPLLQLVRAPGRFNIFFILSIGILAAFGVAALKHKVAKVYLPFIYASIAILFFAEIWQTNTPYVRVPSSWQTPPVYRWLAARKPQTVIAELPLTPMHWGNSIESQITKKYDQLTEFDMLASETYRVYFSSFHQKQMINGYSGFFPESYYNAAIRLASFPSEDSIDLLHALNVTYAVVHMQQYSPEKRKDLYTTLSSETRLKQVVTFGEDYVYKIVQ